MKKLSNEVFGLALAAGVGLGIGCGYLIFNERLRSQIGRKIRRMGRSCRHQTGELRESAGELLEKGERNWREARNAGKKVYQKLAG